MMNGFCICRRADALEAENKRLQAAYKELRAASQTVFDGLDARIDAAVDAKHPVPVFNGIADLHDALHRGQQSHEQLTRQESK